MSLRLRFDPADGAIISSIDHVEGPAGEIEALGLLDVDTVLTPQKALRQVRATAMGQAFDGFEMHMGETTGPDCQRAFALLDGNKPDGAMSADGRVIGSYIHGAFASTGLRAGFIERLGSMSDRKDHSVAVDTTLDAIARELETHLDVDGLLNLARG